MPSELSKDARKEWKRITIELERLGLISNLDRAALYLYCQAWGELVLLERAFAARRDMLAEKGISVREAYIGRTPKGYEMQAVDVQLINSLREQVHRYLQSFGLSPSSRGRVRASPQMELPGIGEKPVGWGAFAS